MTDSAEQARKFQEFCRSWSDDCSKSWQEAFHSWLKFQKQLATEYDESLREERREVEKFSASKYARTLMNSYLSAVTFQREQMRILLDSQIHWTERYRHFLEHLERGGGADPSDAEQ
jgi:kynureninase